jgi:hypothetical protein
MTVHRDAESKAVFCFGSNGESGSSRLNDHNTLLPMGKIYAIQEDFWRTSLLKIAIVASLVSAAWLPSAFAAPAVENGVDQAQVPSMVQAQAIQSWHEDMVRSGSTCGRLLSGHVPQHSLETGVLQSGTAIFPPTAAAYGCLDEVCGERGCWWYADHRQW